MTADYFCLFQGNYIETKLARLAQGRGSQAKTSKTSKLLQLISPGSGSWTATRKVYIYLFTPILSFS